MVRDAKKDLLAAAVQRVPACSEVAEDRGVDIRHARQEVV